MPVDRGRGCCAAWNLEAMPGIQCRTLVLPAVRLSRCPSPSARGTALPLLYPPSPSPSPTSASLASRSIRCFIRRTADLVAPTSSAISRTDMPAVNRCPKQAGLGCGAMPRSDIRAIDAADRDRARARLKICRGTPSSRTAADTSASGSGPIGWCRTGRTPSSFRLLRIHSFIRSLHVHAGGRARAVYRMGAWECRLGHSGSHPRTISCVVQRVRRNAARRPSTRRFPAVAHAVRHDRIG
jgi:hypothetical protein